MLLEKGLSLADIEGRSGIVRKDLDNPDIRIPMDRVMKLARIAYEVLRDPALGLHLAETRLKTPYHFITNLALSCDTLEDALGQWVRYARLESDTSRVEMCKEGRDTVLRYADTSHYQAVWLQELYMATIITNCRNFVCNTIQPLEVRFRHREPPYIEEYKRIFQAPVRFGAEENAIKFSCKDMQRTLPTGNPLLKAVMRKQANMAIEKKAHAQSMKQQAAAWIIEFLPRAKADLKTIAAAMNMEPGSMQRKLKRENTSFSKLLELVRQQLALEYLKGDHSIKEIAHLLHYSDPIAFQHAFKNWFGHSPGAFRKNL
ncbi:MAG: AraC family transcriptional regulator [Desulfobacterales bacterium]|nr:AraC family transcriptional regulator [Desulfobacterales bacterium]